MKYTGRGAQLCALTTRTVPNLQLAVKVSHNSAFSSSLVKNKNLFVVEEAFTSMETSKRGFFTTKF
ncbi:hypothetical protein A6S26_19755 [Nostoc sp. ATCC 43529]|nr:hypothetical protein A6S26_19755 [Nostoc sp. ATCC 43529]